MLKKNITFENLDGEEISEDFYFHMSKAELVELELASSNSGGFGDKLKQMIQSKDGKLIMETFKGIILDSYGERSEDGRRFIKSKELRDAFVQTDAYSVLFMELCLSPDAAATFINGIIPASLSAEVEAIEEANLPEPVEEPAYIAENREPTAVELQAMSKTELLEAMKRKNAL